MSNYPDNFNQAAFNAHWSDLTEAEEAWLYHSSRTLDLARKAFEQLPASERLRETIIMAAVSSAQRDMRQYIGDGVSDQERKALASIIGNNRDGELGGVEDALDDLFAYYRRQLQD